MELNKMLNEYRNGTKANHPKRIKFEGVDEEKDIYNISAPFVINDETYLLGRVESRDSESSEIFAFKKENDIYVKDNNFTTLALQDPFVTFIDGQIVVGGVETQPKEDKPNELDWWTVFYAGNDLFDLKRIFAGPKGMKDLRLKQLEDERILVLTRPQGEKGGRGKIGAAIIDSLNDLTVELIEETPLLKQNFQFEEWGGANDVYLVDADHVGVLGHIANFDNEGNRHYYPMTFLLDINTLDISNPKIIAERSDFLSGPSKRPDLIDVVFSGGIDFSSGSNIATLYCGISDADAQSIEIPHPFQ
ncbi:DUF1861 family protein [Fundicoccus sp. Sow4_H7]|uniref:DUF1861 family protein n=1 Tax=Fundicoccus sp. Sow4_H7 TaxID=3438784 RepID=UPI003F903513